VIADVQHALRGLLTPLLPPACDVRFGPPADRAPGPDEAALVFFLAAVREDDTGNPDWEDLRDDDGRVVARRPPVRRFDLRYHVTAEAADTDAEARLLDAVLAAVDPGKRVPAELVGDALAGKPVLLRLGEPAYPLPGLPLRTALTVVANAPLVLPSVPAAAPAEDIQLGVAAPGRPAPRPAAAGPRGWRGRRIEEE
jgi:Pvc16 N-terminal domain